MPSYAKIFYFQSKICLNSQNCSEAFGFQVASELSYLGVAGCCRGRRGPFCFRPIAVKCFQTVVIQFAQLEVETIIRIGRIGGALLDIFRSIDAIEREKFASISSEIAKKYFLHDISAPIVTIANGLIKTAACSISFPSDPTILFIPEKTLEQ